MKPYVYKITRINPDTKEVVYHANGQPYYYIGVHNGTDPKYFAHGCRWNHYSDLKKSNSYFAKAVRKYGFESFKKEIIKEFDLPVWFVKAVEKQKYKYYEGVN